MMDSVRNHIRGKWAMSVYVCKHRRLTVVSDVPCDSHNPAKTAGHVT